VRAGEGDTGTTLPAQPTNQWYRQFPSTGDNERAPRGSPDPGPPDSGLWSQFNSTQHHPVFPSISTPANRCTRT